MLVDRESGKSKGSAFVQMCSIQEAIEATNVLYQKELNGREIYVRLADNQVY